MPALETAYAWLKLKNWLLMTPDQHIVCEFVGTQDKDILTVAAIDGIEGGEYEMKRISGTFDELRGAVERPSFPMWSRGIPVQREQSRYFMSWLNPAPMC